MFNFMQKTLTSLQATTSYEMGLLNLGLKQYPTAIKHFTQAIEHDAKYVDAFYHRSIAFEEMGEQEKATADLQKAAKLNPKFLNDMFTSAMADIDFKLYQSAIEKFDNILRANPKLYKVFSERALVKCAQGKYKEAIQDFNEAIKLKLTERTYCDRGNAKAALGLYEEAMADYQQALQLNPQSTYALLSRGVTTYQLGGRYHQALADFEKVLELDSTYAPALYHEGIVKFELGDISNADLALGRSITIAENKKAKNVNTYVMSGIVKLITDSEVTAATKFEYASELIGKQTAFDPSDINIKIELLEHWESIGSFQLQKNYGIEKFKKSINEANYPNLAALAYYYIARAYQINSTFDKAEETFLQSIKLEENSRVNYEYANLLIKQEKWIPAISKLQRAIELANDGKCITYYRLSSPLLVSPPLREELKLLPRLYIRVSVIATWQLINCYTAAGEKDNAEQQLNNLLKAVRDFPTPLAYSLLGYACQALKQWQLAARSFKTASLLRVNYSLAQQNLKKCLEQLSLQESDVEPFAIIAQISQLPISSQSQMIDLQQPLTQLSEHSRISQSINPLVLSDEQQEPTKKLLAQRNNLNSTQHKNYQEEMGEQEKATADLQKAVELNPKFLEDMFASAVAEVDLKLYQSAIKKFDDILRVNPKLYKVFNARALVKRTLRNYNEAIQDFNEAIKLKPEERTYCDRGNAKAVLGLYEGAMADYQQALQLNPQSTYALLSRGVTVYKLGGRYHQALTDIKKVLELDSTYALALYHAGVVKFELGNYKNADVTLDHAITIEENKKAKNVNTYVMSGIVKLTTGLKIAAAARFDNASCELIDKKIAFDPSDIETKIELLEHVESIGVDAQLLEGFIQENNVNLKKLKESINEANYPNLASLAYYYIARVYQINSVFDKTELVKAEETFLQSIKLEENSRVIYEYANLLVKQKKWMPAISKLQRAIELSNDGKCVTYYKLSSPLLVNPPLREELKLIPRLYIRVSVLATWQLINCYCVVGEKSNAEQQLDNLLKAVADFPTPLAYSLLGYAYRAFKQWALAARSFKTAVLLRANYSLAQQNLQNCLNQLSVQENEIEPFEIIAQVQQLLVSQNSEPGKQEQESTIPSAHSPQSLSEVQAIDKQTETERSKLNPKQHVSYESMSNRASSEVNFVNEVKSATYQEIYLLTNSHKSGEQLLKLPMEEFVDNKDQKSSEQKLETETALPPVPNLPNRAKEENNKEPDDGQKIYKKPGIY